MASWPASDGRTLLLGLVFWLGLALIPVSAQDGVEPLDIVTATGPHHYSVEVMRSDAGREKGLMFRKFMPTDRGMLFDFQSERQVTMWMKNTYLPLDMVFIDHVGKVVGVAQNAEPLSETVIASDAPASAVLELNAGTAGKIGLKIGDRIAHKMFAN